jgi:hypothetical protein
MRSERLSVHAQCRLDRNRPDRGLRVVGSVGDVGRVGALTAQQLANGRCVRPIGADFIRLN